MVNVEDDDVDDTAGSVQTQEAGDACPGAQSETEYETEIESDSTASETETETETETLGGTPRGKIHLS